MEKWLLVAERGCDKLEGGRRIQDPLGLEREHQRREVSAEDR